MSPQPLEYAVPTQARSRVRRAWTVTAFFTLSWLAANIVLFIISRSVVGGFEGMGVEAFGAITLNGLTVLIAIALSVWIGRAAGSVVLTVFLVLDVLLPALALVLLGELLIF